VLGCGPNFPNFALGLSLCRFQAGRRQHKVIELRRGTACTTKRSTWVRESSQLFRHNISPAHSVAFIFCLFLVELCPSPSRAVIDTHVALLRCDMSEVDADRLCWLAQRSKVHRHT